MKRIPLASLNVGVSSVLEHNKLHDTVIICILLKPVGHLV